MATRIEKHWAGITQKFAKSPGSWPPTSEGNTTNPRNLREPKASNCELLPCSLRVIIYLRFDSWNLYPPKEKITAETQSRGAETYLGFSAFPRLCGYNLIEKSLQRPERKNFELRAASFYLLAWGL